jgi:hypothetical protein
MTISLIETQLNISFAIFSRIVFCWSKFKDALKAQALKRPNTTEHTKSLYNISIMMMHRNRESNNKAKCILSPASIDLLAAIYLLLIYEVAKCDKKLFKLVFNLSNVGL